VHQVAAAQARQRGLPHVLAPCGMLMPGALRHHWWKKVPVWLWFQGRALREAQCLHAKSNKEYEDIRRFGLRNPVAIIPNPIFSPLSSLPTAAVDFRRAHQLPDDRKIVLFLGRLHRVKGVARLIEAWAGIQNEKAESRKQKAEVRGQWSVVGGQWSGSWQLVLAGPDEGGYRRELESLVAGLGCQGSVMFTGELDEDRKWAALRSADLFVMPSNFENFGNAIVEAMLCGVPVITTTGTPWKALPAEGAGWCVEPTSDALAAALREALGMAEEKRKNMGRRAADFANRFRPEQAGADLIQVYRWLLKEIPCPACVRLD
jgi:glycosyltransferase involved in cell wall biosynthesis